jgi:ferritin-like metal-binding protein YciE
MAAKTLHELFVEELRDMYDAEKRLVRALPKLAKAAESETLRQAFISHLRETEKQTTRLEQVFRSIGEKPRGKKCDGIMGIIEESNTAMEELETGPILDAALIAGAQKVEHYEIASYGTLASFADLMNHDKAKDLLGQTLEEEKAADKKLNAIATSEVNRQALLGDDEDMGVPFTMPRGMRRAAATMGLAHDQPRPRTAARTRSSARRTKKR